MIDCPNAEIRDRLPDLLHERLDASVRAAVMSHVADCSDCRIELELLQEAHVVLSSGLRAIDVSSVARVVVSRMAKGSMAPRRRSWTDWRIAASIAVLAIGATSVVMLRDRSKDSGAVVAPVALSVPAESVPASPPASPEHVVGATSPAVAPSAELAAAAEMSDLSESDLRALVDDLQTLDALPPTEPDPVTVRVALPGSESSE
jgi:hypothetical protein